MNIVKRLKDSLEYEYNLSFSERKQLLEEIDRLNNIISELEKWLNKISKLTANIDEKMTCKNVLDKLKELKENNK